MGRMSEPTSVEIRGEMIRLGQLLKLAGVVEDGAQARALIENGHVRVDGEVERRRGRQVPLGGLVELPGGALVVTTA